ncbi:ABC transporter permease [Streptomyces iconiensis]|uniref:ABC transporter permease subunit n=1 Tax=Streptomyces iconiensis TaxID=1384038 RepID=A0ABT7A1H3_9ACTN|nr:ABC transporter permease [Streptomyces iconiensis]MDJ1135180.1 ABC transporter permease subunit [Streptomyces iconiensis]
MSTQQQYQGQVPPQQPGRPSQPQQTGHAQQQAQPQQAQQVPQQQAQQHGWSGQGGGATYTSPIPPRRTHLGNAIVSEWTKIRSVRSTVWTIAIMFALVVGIGLLSALAMSGGQYTGNPLLSSGLFGLMLGQICVITLGVLVITSEYGTGMIRTTLTACPQRGRVLMAKSLVFFVLAFVTTTVACTITALINSALLSDQEIPSYVRNSSLADSVEGGRIVADSGEWLGATVGAGLYVALLGLLSLAVGALLRHSAGAITTMMGVVLLPLLLAMFMRAEALETVRDKLMEYSPLNGLGALFGTPMLPEDSASGWPLLGGLAGVTAVALVVACTLLNKRDV